MQPFAQFHIARCNEPLGRFLHAGIVTEDEQRAHSIVLVPDSRGAWGAGLAVLMAAIAAVDARRFIIPDELTAAALALGLAYAAVEDADIWAQALAWAVVRGAIPALAFLGVRAANRRWRDPARES